MTLVREAVPLPFPGRLQENGYVSFRVAGVWLALPVARVQEVLGARTLTPVPLATPFLAGLLNLRGEIVSVIDLRHRLGLPPRDGGRASFHVVVRDGDELFALQVDEVGDVVEATAEEIDEAPSTLPETLRRCAPRVIRREGGLLLAALVDELLSPCDAGC